MTKLEDVARSMIEKSRHQQNHVDWNDLGESYKVSFLRMAEEKLKADVGS